MSWHHQKHLVWKTIEDTFMVIFLPRERINNYFTSPPFGHPYAYVEYMFISFHTIYIHTTHTNTYYSQLTPISPFENVPFAVVLSKHFTYLCTAHHISFASHVFFSPKIEISWSYQPPGFCVFFVVTNALHFFVTRSNRKCVILFTNRRHPLFNNSQVTRANFTLTELSLVHLLYKPLGR